LVAQPEERAIVNLPARLTLAGLVVDGKRIE
jgi:hypothetical protein